MLNLCDAAIATAKRRGARYADARIIESRDQRLLVRNHAIATAEDAESLGCGVRALVDGCWGFAATPDVTPQGVQKAAAEAVEVARASRRLKAGSVGLAPVPPVTDRWHPPCLVDPFTIPLQEKLDLLYRLNDVLKQGPKIAAAEATMGFWRERKWLATTDGARIDQTLLTSGAGFQATAVGEGESQTRSYPMSFGGQYAGLGYELIPALDLLAHAEQTREEAIALLTAAPCPDAEMDLVIDGTQLALQIHESVGHPTELDRVLGTEESYAGRSFATMEKKGRFRYASPHVTLVADGTIPTGLATYGYDDDGVRAQRWFMVDRGRLAAYSTNREFSHQAGEPPRGTCRAESWARFPLIRIPNLSLMPGDTTLARLIAETKDGLFLTTNRCWSIDQMRLNFEFGCEIGWRIRNGKLAEMVKSPSYRGIPPRFWTSCDGVADESHWKLWGVVNCGKGQPGQRAQMSHGAAPARFRNVKVFPGRA